MPDCCFGNVGFRMPAEIRFSVASAAHASRSENRDVPGSDSPKVSPKVFEHMSVRCSGTDGGLLTEKQQVRPQKHETIRRVHSNS